MPNRDKVTSVTSWTRIEPHPRSRDFIASLEARIHDPLWLLARQWQFGEFQGEDCGSPVKIDLETIESRISHFLPGKLNANTPVQPYDSYTMPLEPLVENEPKLRVGVMNFQQSAEMGLNFLRMLGTKLTNKYREAYLQIYAITRSKGDEFDEETLKFLNVANGRLLDGIKLYERLASSRDCTGAVQLPDEPPFETIASSDFQAVVNVTTKWLSWCDSFYPSSTKTSWVPERMEYEFAVSVPVNSGLETQNGELLLTARDYSGEHLDWYSFDAANSALEKITKPGLLINGKQQSTVTSKINIGRPGCVRDIEIMINILYLDISALVVELLSPSGKKSILYDRKGKGNHLCTSYSGKEGSLAAFLGESTDGDWILKITDVTGKGFGALKMWSIKIGFRSLSTESPTESKYALIPCPVRFRGMPSNRFWEFEDAHINFGSVEAAPDDLARLLLMEFTLIFGNDFFLVPLDLSVGSICNIKSCEVTNTFGETSRICSAAERGRFGRWRMFLNSLDARWDDADEIIEMLFLPPVLSATLEGKPIEEILLLRDEMANMAWAVEHIVESPGGKPINRFEAWQERCRRNEKSQSLKSKASPSGVLLYKLAAEVPEYWIPLLPKQLQGDQRSIGLERDNHSDIQGRLLEPEQSSLILHEESVPRSGTQVQRAFQFARWIDGQSYVWIGRYKKPGRGEGSSGIIFDSVEASADSA
jgi:subtilisin-like proprotein convertase family protein